MTEEAVHRILRVLYPSNPSAMARVGSSYRRQRGKSDKMCLRTRHPASHCFFALVGCNITMVSHKSWDIRPGKYGFIKRLLSHSWNCTTLYRYVFLIWLLNFALSSIGRLVVQSDSAALQKSSNQVPHLFRFWCDLIKRFGLYFVGFMSVKSWFLEILHIVCMIPDRYYMFFPDGSRFCRPSNFSRCQASQQGGWVQINLKTSPVVFYGVKSLNFLVKRLHHYGKIHMLNG